MNLILLLTASVNINEGISHSKLQDSLIRRKQYEQALEFYLTKTKYKIVVAENSNTNIKNDSHLKYIEEKRLEFLTFSGNKFAKELGKGYGETLIIEYAIKNSELCKECDYIVKITGRLIVHNICGLLNECLLIDKKGFFVAADSAVRGSYTASYFYVAHKSFYNDFFFTKMKSCINDIKGICFENVLFDLIQDWIKCGNRFHEFYQVVDVEGISGATCKNYPSNNLSNRMKVFIKAIMINIFCFKNQ